MIEVSGVPVFDSEVTEDYSLYNGDSFELIHGLPDNSIGYGVTSPPFSSLYVYSASIRDAGNCRNDREFFDHFSFLIHELRRVIKPGRLFSCHCMNLPSTKNNHGYIGLRDFRGALIRAFINDEAGEFYEAINRLEWRRLQAIEADDLKRASKIEETINTMRWELENYPPERGWIFHSEVTIFKDPLVAATRTHAIGLAHQQLVKDSAICRQGIPDYLVTFRKAGDNEEPIAHPNGMEEFYGENPPKGNYNPDQKKNKKSHLIWQRYASPTWQDIDMSDTLQYESARANNDERHVCPLQLGVIRRCLQLWSNPSDTVLDPFNGIGSTGAVCLDMGRKYVGFELKESYFKAAKNNLRKRQQEVSSDLFSMLQLA